MSSFIVSMDCMNNIINGLFWNQKLKSWYNSSYREQNLNKSEDFERLAEKLYLLNQAAVIQRYPGDKTEYIQMPKFEWKNKTVNNFQLLKSLQCLKYQCTEGDIDKEPLYKWLSETIICLQNLIINQIPAYEKAKWD